MTLVYWRREPPTYAQSGRCSAFSVSGTRRTVLAKARAEWSGTRPAPIWVPLSPYLEQRSAFMLGHDRNALSWRLKMDSRVEDGRGSLEPIGKHPVSHPQHADFQH